MYEAFPPWTFKFLGCLHCDRLQFKFSKAAPHLKAHCCIPTDTIKRQFEQTGFTINIGLLMALFNGWLEILHYKFRSLLRLFEFFRVWEIKQIFLLVLCEKKITAAYQKNSRCPISFIQRKRRRNYDENKRK